MVNVKQVSSGYAATWLLGSVVALGLAAAGCSADRSAIGQAEEELSAAQCDYFAVDGKVTVCHRTGSAKKPYTIIRVNSAGCAAGHAGHAGDYVGSNDPASPLYDPTCNGQGCFPVGAPFDGSVECCDGLAPAGGVCADIDECAANTDDCDANATCTNTIGSFTCACNAGFTGDGNTCTDIDECSAGTATCGANSTCTNTPGSYACACQSGFAGDATGRDCLNIDDCAGAPCHNGGTCADGINAFTCTCAPGFGGPTCDATTCGDGIRAGAEQCDDGNLNNSDGCLSTCQAAVCGDGVVRTGVEQCDDGNTVNGDGCSAACTIEVACGNGRLDPGEQCDDGNAVNGDGCSATCTVEPRCGDGVVNQPTEVCDRGALNGTVGSGCRADCTLEVGIQLSARIHEHCDPGSTSILFNQDTPALNWPPNLNLPSYVTLGAHTGVIVYSGANFTGQQRTFTVNTNFCFVSYPNGLGVNDQVYSLQLFFIP